MTPFHADRYPADWPIISKRIRQERAGNRCEWCGAENHKPHPVTGSMVVLTVAHLPGADTMTRDESQMAALCQKCHNGLDAPMRAQHAAETRRAQRDAASGQLALFEEQAA